MVVGTLVSDSWLSSLGCPPAAVSVESRGEDQPGNQGLVLCRLPRLFLMHGVGCEVVFVVVAELRGDTEFLLVMRPHGEDPPAAGLGVLVLPGMLCLSACSVPRLLP